MANTKEAISPEILDKQGNPIKNEGANEIYIYSPEQEVILKVKRVEDQKLSDPVVPEELKDNPEIIKTEQEAETKLEQAKEEAKANLIKSIAIVGVEKKVQDVATDRGAYEMTEEAKKLRGFGGFFKKLWKHQFAREAYHFDKQRLAQKKILADNNIFANETDDEGKALTQEIKTQKQSEFAKATADRFLVKISRNK
ncbi:MAG: hypothetical protein NTX66_04305 [Candidatus Falkowbacteria bacterium]|nr:hypothetical protein [Candidatus Falkowbacteria bacterium]